VSDFRQGISKLKVETFLDFIQKLEVENDTQISNKNVL
jgi:hypothetical protein